MTFYLIRSVHTKMLSIWLDGYCDIPYGIMRTTVRNEQTTSVLYFKQLLLLIVAVCLGFFVFVFPYNTFLFNARDVWWMTWSKIPMTVKTPPMIAQADVTKW